MRFIGHLTLAVVVAAGALTVTTRAVTRLASADGQYWDVQDTSPWAQDSGGIATGGRASPFNGFGYLKIRVRRPDGSTLAANHYLRGFGLAHDGAERFDSITPVLVGDTLVSRALYAPRDTSYLRYFDSLTNTSREVRHVEVAWGGAVGAYAEGGLAAVALTSSGDRTLDSTDTFAAFMQNVNQVADPLRGPSGHGPSAHVLGTATDGSSVAAGANGPRTFARRVGDMYGDPFTDAYPGFDPAHVGHVFSLSLEPGKTAALLTFVVKGLSELYDPRGGPPLAMKNAIVGTSFDPVYAGADAKVPPAGSEIAKVIVAARRLIEEPDLRGLTTRQRSQIVNWTLERPAPSSFTVFEQSVSQLQDAMTRGAVTSEDIVREYLARLATYDRAGPTFRSMLSLNPQAIATARQRDAERAAGTSRGPFHGVPVVFKDNIDALELPTTGGSRALLEHRPRLDARVVAGMRRAGAIVLGKANLDEFPFGDFGVSTVAGTIGNAYDPSLSTAGSSGGSAVAVATSMAAIGFGTDTCNSLSNPSAFASLATIRTTRGLTSRSGVMPLNTYNDAVGPMARSVRDVALALDEVVGSDPEDPVTADADAHVRGSFAATLDTAVLTGVRIGLLRQRFVGFTGEREVAAAMERVAGDLQRAGATVVEVTIPDLDERFLAARGSAPGSLKAGWTAYLTRGAAATDRVLTIEDLLASGKLAPVSAARLRAALAPIPEGAALDEATRAFVASRETFRQVFVDLMERERLAALLYPANHARPHTHEGGQVRYGSEPGTCEESAMTGLPQVTVPAGFIGNRYPVGASFLGRMWDDRRLLEIAYAYEQATHHRRPPDTVR